MNDSQSLPQNVEERTEQFVHLQTRYQQRVFWFILTLVPHWADAEVVLQETNAILWRKFSEFDQATDFVKWANQVSYWEVLKFHKRAARQHEHIQFGDGFIEQIAEEVQQSTDRLQQQRDALAACLEKLAPRDRAMIEDRYQAEGTIESVAERAGRGLWVCLIHLSGSLRKPCLL